MSMNFLLLYLGEGLKFSHDRIREQLHRMKGISRLKEGDHVGSCLDAAFDTDSDSTIIRLTPDLETISISGSGDASLELALNIQRTYPDPIHIVDSNYSFDLILRQYSSVAELRSAMQKGG